MMMSSQSLQALLLLLWLRQAYSSTEGGGPVLDLKAPPLGFMSWERFRCEIDCDKHPDECINEDLYVSMADALVLGGYADAGYKQVSIDDCWSDGRDPTTNRLKADAKRFPHGIEWLADYLHSQGLEFGLYADAGMQTCGHYAGSQGHEALDAQTFADWGVDYLKLDGCHVEPWKHFEERYTAFGDALKAASATRPIVFSCSWPAYIGDDESTKPYDVMFHKAGCNTWRNSYDVDNKWSRLLQIIMHWADYWQELRSVPEGSFNDADMLLAGDDHYGHLISIDQARLQMGFWAMIASPLFIGGDVRKIPEDYRTILLNKDVIAINQDSSRKQAACVQGCKGTSTGNTTNPIQVWSKSLDYGKSSALAFLNLQEAGTANIAYNYTVEGVIARCVDLWSKDPHKDVCAGGQGASIDEWDTRIVASSNDAVILQIEARQVATTSHRLLRIDYFCAGDCAQSSS